MLLRLSHFPKTESFKKQVFRLEINRFNVFKSKYAFFVIFQEENCSSWKTHHNFLHYSSASLMFFSSEDFLCVLNNRKASTCDPHNTQNEPVPILDEPAPCSSKSFQDSFVRPSEISLPLLKNYYLHWGRVRKPYYNHM